MTKQSKSEVSKEITKMLFQEIKQQSDLTWSELYALIEQVFPGVIFSEAQLRHLGCGKRPLNEIYWPQFAKWAITIGCRGGFIEEASKYELPENINITDAEKQKDEKQQKRRELRYVKEMEQDTLSFLEKQDELIAQERTRVVANLTRAIEQMAPAGFSNADTIYMVNAWLKTTPPSIERGERQAKIVLYVDGNKPDYHEVVDVSNLPNNLIMPEHREGFLFRITTSITPI
jgi:hypothetical protein